MSTTEQVGPGRRRRVPLPPQPLVALARRLGRATPTSATPGWPPSPARPRRSTLRSNSTVTVGGEGDTQCYLLAVCTTPGSITWPAAGASKAAVVAAADALMSAAGADAHARAHIAPRVGGLWTDAATARRPWSGRPAGALFRTYVAGPAVRHVMRLERHRNPVAPDEWFPAMRATRGAAFTAVEAVLGDRPVLALHFGEEAMNPTGGVIAVQWSSRLVLGILMPIVHT